MLLPSVSTREIQPTTWPATMASREKRSKRRSGTKLPIEKQLEGFVFFIDRSLGKNVVPLALREVGINVEIHADHFADDAPDELWLAECGSRDWVVLAKDKQIRYNELERIALLKAGVASFILISGNLAGAAANIYPPRERRPRHGGTHTQRLAHQARMALNRCPGLTQFCLLACGLFRQHHRLARRNLRPS